MLLGRDENHWRDKTRSVNIYDNREWHATKIGRSDNNRNLYISELNEATALVYFSCIKVHYMWGREQN